MAKPTYFQKVVARKLDSAQIQPASGLLTRWSQVANVNPSGVQKASQKPLNADAQVSQLNRPQFAKANRSELAIENVQRTPAMNAILSEAKNESRSEPRHELPPIEAPSKAISRLKPLTPEPSPESKVDPVAQTKLASASAPPRRQERKAEAKVEKYETNKPVKGSQPVNPEVQQPKVLPPQQVVTATKAVHDRVERQIVMPAKREPAPALPPPVAKQGTTVQIGTIEVRVVREVKPAPATPAPRQETKSPLAVASTGNSSSSPSAPISRKMGGAFGFHQS